MALVTARLIQLASGVAVDVVMDDVTYAVSSITVSNTSSQPVEIRVSAAGQVGLVAIPAGELSFPISPPDLLETFGTEVSMGMVV